MGNAAPAGEALGSNLRRLDNLTKERKNVEAGKALVEAGPKL